MAKLMTPGKETSGLLGTRLQRRIMLRVIPTLMLTFVAISFIVFMTIRFNERDKLAQENITVVESLNATVMGHFEDLVEDLADIADDPAMREIATLKTNLSEFDFGLAQGRIAPQQEQILAEFDHLITRNVAYFQFVRYVHNDQSVIFLVENLGTDTRIQSFLESQAPTLEEPITISSSMSLVSSVSDELIIMSRPVIERGTAGNALGVVQVGFSPQLFADAQAQALVDSPNGDENRRALLVDRNNRIIADTGDAVEDSVPGAALTLLGRRTGRIEHVDIGDGFYLSTHSLRMDTDANSPWRVVLIDDWNQRLSEAYTTPNRIALALIVTGAILTGLIALILRRMLTPIESLGETVSRLASGSVSPIPLPQTTSGLRDELDEMLAGVGDISRRMSQLDQNLRNQTYRRNRDLQIAARIGREVATLYDIDILLSHAINLICEGFGFYHGQIFLIDDSNQNAILAFSRGEAGQKMLERGHKLPVGSQSVVGTVAAKGEPVIINDVAQRDPNIPFRPNPVLPDTLAEMGLPLVLGDRIIGVLDIHSLEANVFHEEDVPTFQLLADQFAVAIMNARLKQQSEERVAQIDRLNRQLTRQVWQEAGKQMNLSGGFRYNLLDIEELRDDIKLDTGLTSEIRIRNEVVGYLSAEAGQGEEFSDSDEMILRAVADRVALAIENARLFQETQTSLSETSALYELSRVLNDAETPDQIIESIINTIFPDASGGRVWVFDEIQAGQRPEWLELVADVAAVDRSEPGLPLGSRLRISDYPFLDQLQPDQVIWSQDIEQDERIGERLLSTLRRFNQRAVVFIPLIVRAKWRGLIVLGFAEPRAFSERDRRIFSALSDQAGVVIDNRLLLDRVQQEQETLSSILETLPAGVLVLDPQTLKPIQYNQQIREYLGEIDRSQPFSPERYGLYRTGSDTYYPEDEIAIIQALRQGQQALNDDVMVKQGEKTLDLQVAASLIQNEAGEVSFIVAGFQDITNLRLLEATLQDNLMETLTNLQTQRQLIEAETLDDVYEVIVSQMMVMVSALGAYIILNDNDEIRVGQHTGPSFEQPDALRPVLDPIKTVIFDRLEKAGLPDETFSVLKAAGVQSLISLPLRTSTRIHVVGWLVAVSGRPGQFTIQHERQLMQLIDMSGTAIDNRLLIADQQATVSEVRKLYTVTSNISRSSGSPDRLRVVLLEALASMEPDYCTAMVGYGIDWIGLEPVLFNQAADGLEFIDFAAIMRDYEIPPWGIHIDDLYKADELDHVQQQLLAVGLRAVSMVSFQPNEQVPGFMLVGYRTPHRFSDGDERYLNTLADSASIVYNNLLLFQQTQTALEEVSTLYEAGKALADATSPSEVVQVVVRHLVPSQVNQVFLGLLAGSTWDAPGATMEIVADWVGPTGINLKGVSLSQEQFAAWGLLSSEHVQYFDDINARTDLDMLVQASITSLGARSLVVIPLQVPGRPVGVIWIASPEPLGLSDSELRTFEAFGEQASLSLEAARLLEQTEYRARQLETSATVSRSASQILDLEELLPQLVDLIRVAFDYDHVQIFLMDANNDYAVLRASTGEAGQQLLSIHHKLQRGSNSVIGQVTLRGEPVIALDTADASVVHAPNPYLPYTRSEMALPLIVKGQIVGALDVQSNQPNKFDEEDIKALTALAAQISVAIDNASLYAASQRQADRMSFLFRITSAAAAAETLEESINLITRFIQEETDALAVATFLTQTYMDETGNSYSTLKAAALEGVAQPLHELEEIRLDDPSNVLAKVGRRREARVISSISTNTNYLPIAAHARSAALLPLAIGTELIALLVVEDERQNAFDLEFSKVLETLTGSLTAVVQSKRLLEQIQRTNEQLRELDRLKSDFLANMSHELRTPLNSIIGFSRVMLKGIDGPLTEMQEQDLTTIYSSGQHLLILINDILDQAKIAANKLDLKFDFFDVKPVIEAVKSIGIGLVKEKNLNLAAEIAPNLPKVYGDEVRTRQILINLVSNAAKFTQEGGITIRCYATQHDETGKTMVRVDVEDTGIGIAEKDMPLLFEAFRQVDSSLTRTQGGTGLGLPISKSLTEMQGGEMLVSSQVNIGSVFSIILPVEASEPISTEAPEGVAVGEVQVESAHEVEPPPNKPKTAPLRQTTEMPAASSLGPRPPAVNKREVLLIEDNKDMVDQFRRILQREGFEVVTADHPTYAEAMVSNLRPTVILMDVNFTEGKGWDILGRLKERDDTFDIPVVVVTLSDESERAYQMGVHHFIQRPFAPEDLVSAVLDAERESNLDRILIIDDQPEDVRLLSQVLNENGDYRVFTAGDGKEGMSMVARRRPDLIVLDLRMPNMDGFAVLNELRSNPETFNIPVLVVTGEVDLSSDEQSRLGNVRVLPKIGISQSEYDQFIKDVRRELNLEG